MSMRPLHPDGVRLAQALGACEALGDRSLERALVVAIPPGGVLIADALARGLGSPLDAVCAARLHAPGGPAVAAIAEGGAMVVDDAALAGLHLTIGDLDPLVDAARQQLTATADELHGLDPDPSLVGCTVIVVDGVVKSGLTARAAVAAMLARRAARVVVATPLCSTEAHAALTAAGHEVVALELAPADEVARLYAERPRPRPASIGQLRELLARARRELAA